MTNTTDEPHPRDGRTEGGRGRAPPPDPSDPEGQGREPDPRSRARFHVLVLVVVLILSTLVIPLASELGPQRAFVIVSDSMEPAIPEGSLVLVEPGEPEVGDVIAYETRIGGNQVHRVVDAEEQDGETHYVTKGDNNEARDSYTVPEGDVHGVVTSKVPHLGLPWTISEPLRVGLFVGLVAVYLSICAWEARLVPSGDDEEEGRTGMGARLSRMLPFLLVLVVVPGIMAAVLTVYPESAGTHEVYDPSPLPMSEGTMGAANVNSDENNATVTVDSPKLWREVVLWGCDPGADTCTPALPSTYTEEAGTLTQVDVADHDPDPTVYFEAVLAAPTNEEAFAILHNASSGTDVAASEVSTTQTSPTLVRSGPFTLSGSAEYTVRIKNSGSSSGGEFRTAKLVTEQTYPTAIQTQVRVSGADTTDNKNSFVVPKRAATWLYEGNSLDGVVAVYFEAVAEVQTNSGTVRLVDRTSSTEVASLSFSSTTPNRLRSTDISGSLTAGNEYEVEMSRDGGRNNRPMSLHLARMVVDQSGFNDTVRYVDLTWTNTTTDTSFVDTGYDGRYHMDSEWGGIEGFFESTLANTQSGQTASARLVDNSNGTAFSGSRVDVTGTTLTRSRSSAVTLNTTNVTYGAQMKASGGTADVRNAWIVVHQQDGKTYDHVLSVSNDPSSACTRDFTMEHVSSSSLGRIDFANVTLRGDSGTQEQVRVESGSVTQTSGTAVSVAGGNTAEVLVTSDPSSSGTSTLDLRLRAECPSTGIATEQDVTVELE